MLGTQTALRYVGLGQSTLGIWSPPMIGAVLEVLHVGAPKDDG